jgi:hypothetical protein
VDKNKKMKETEAKMHAIKIIDFDGHHVGMITQNIEGQLELEVINDRYREDSKSFLQRITSKPVYLTTGERIEKEGKLTFVTRRKRVRPEDPDFLAGVKELLNKTRFGDTRVRGLLLHEGGGHGR